MMAEDRGLLPVHDPGTLAALIAQRCEDAWQDADGWRARCPAHQGTSDNSLHITPTERGIVLHCFAECPQEAVVQALGLTMADLFLPPTRRPDLQIVRTYDYVDATGTLRYQTVRMQPKAFRQRQPDTAQPGRWLWHLRGVELVLYHLPAVLQAVRDETPIYIVEGEKDADTLTRGGYTATCNAMGAKKWHANYTHTLRGAHVVLLADHDATGAQHVALLARELLGHVASLKVITALHTEAPGSDVSDWVAAGGTTDDFDALVAATPVYDKTDPFSDPLGWPASTPPDPPRAPPRAPAAADVPPGRTIEQYRHLLPHVVQQAEEAVTHMPQAPLVFQRARRLVAIAPAEKTVRHITRHAGTPIISAFTPSRLRAVLARAAAWWSPNEAHTKLRPDMPQAWLVDTLLEQETWTFPPLTGLVTAPTLRRDGSLLCTPGYDTATGLWLAWEGATLPAIPEAPTLADAQTALAMLLEPFHDFPFAQPCHASAVLAAILTLIARYAVQSVPLFGISATTRGSGKTLLADCIALIATGRPAPKMPQVKEEEEERKRLLALALDGDPLVVIDNVIGPLGNPALDLAVTSQLFKDRVLGKNATKEAPLYTVFLATGNNLAFQGDLARRVVPIELAPLMERPETRAGFVHPRLLDWLSEERPRLVSAALTVLRAYWVAGRPPQPFEPYGSFEAWSDLIRSALVWGGVPDPCGGRATLESDSDALYEAHAELLTAWDACYGAQPQSLAGILGDIALQGTPPQTSTAGSTSHMLRFDRLREALGYFDHRYDGQRLNAKSIGRHLRKLTGRVIEEKQLLKLTQRGTLGMQWQVNNVPSMAMPSSLHNEENVDSVISPHSIDIACQVNKHEYNKKSYRERTEENAQNTSNTFDTPDADDRVDPFDDLSDVPF
jgi:hypothetical protein